MEIVNLGQKFSLFSNYWSPKIVGELNGQQVKIVKLKGEFVWRRVLLEPASTLNTGNIKSDRTVEELQRL